MEDYNSQTDLINELLKVTIYYPGCDIKYQYIMTNYKVKMRN